MVKKHYHHMSKALTYTACLGPCAILFFLFPLAPIFWVVINSFIYEGEFTFDNYRAIWESAFTMQAFYNSLWLSLISSVLGLLIGLITVNSLRRVPGKIRNAVIAFINMSSNFSGVPLAFAFIIILGTNGALTLLLREIGLIDDFELYGKWGLLAIYTYFQIPLSVLLLYPAFDSLKDEWQEAAALLGASIWQYVYKVALPILTPAMIGTFVILIANAMGAYASVYALTTGNYNVITIRIAALVSGDIFLEPNLAAAISVVLMLIMAFIVMINYTVLNRSRYAKKQ